MERVLFARIAWMSRYEGFKNDPPISGAGWVVDGGTPGECCNFLDVGGFYYGYAKPAGKASEPKLVRIDPTVDGDRLDCVRVIFFAPTKKGQRIIGWYADATVLSNAEYGLPQRIDAQGKQLAWFFKCSVAAAVLLPEQERTFPIPWGKGKTGTSNWTYAIDAKGRPMDSAWIADAIEYTKRIEMGEGGESATKDWADEELRASVVAYRAMQVLERAGERGFKKKFYRDLAERFGRTDSAFEFRMQNISWVLSLLGREWIAGLKPKSHVGADVAARIGSIINELDGTSVGPKVEFELEVLERLKRPRGGVPQGQRAPKKTTTTVTSFVRDPAVKAWVLKRAAGSCESCREAAPFSTPGGIPFLEVHHLITLADGGSDRTSNAAGLCPNCHRRMHFGRDGAEMRQRMYEAIMELKPE